jgi:hypothetical protein
MGGCAGRAEKYNSFEIIEKYSLKNMKIEHWLQLLAVLAGVAVILIPLLGFRRAGGHARGRESGAVASLLRWPVMLVQTVLFILVGVLLWRPLPLALSPRLYESILAHGSLLYFPGSALYLWGYRSLGPMFGISSGFGATLYQNHRLVRNGPYQIVRHPMYLAVILTAFGALLISPPGRWSCMLQCHWELYSARGGRTNC